MVPLLQILEPLLAGSMAESRITWRLSCSKVWCQKQHTECLSSCLENPSAQHLNPRTGVLRQERKVKVSEDGNPFLGLREKKSIPGPYRSSSDAPPNLYFHCALRNSPNLQISSPSPSLPAWRGDSTAFCKDPAPQASLKKATHPGKAPAQVPRIAPLTAQSQGYMM